MKKVIKLLEDMRDNKSIIRFIPIGNYIVVETPEDNIDIVDLEKDDLYDREWHKLLDKAFMFVDSEDAWYIIKVIE